MKFRPLVVIFSALILIPIAAIALQSQRAQLPITIIINVTPNPLGYTHAPGASDIVVARARLHDAPAPIERAFEAQQLHFTQLAPGSIVVAQSSRQKAVEVEAEVTPNPNGTLLTTNASGSQVVVSAEAGVPTTVTCAYTVTVDTTYSNWQLRDGLYSDFTNGTVTWSGTDLSHSTYVSAPKPAATPFVVFQDNGGSWAIVNGSYYSGMKTFCVDLILNIPIATPQGQYVSNAVYTLYY